MPKPYRCTCVFPSSERVGAVLVSQAPSLTSAVSCAAALKAYALYSAGSARPKLRAVCFLATVSQVCLETMAQVESSE